LALRTGPGGLVGNWFSPSLFWGEGERWFSLRAASFLRASLESDTHAVAQKGGCPWGFWTARGCGWVAAAITVSAGKRRPGFAAPCGPLEETFWILGPEHATAMVVGEWEDRLLVGRFSFLFSAWIFSLPPFSGGGGERGQALTGFWLRRCPL